MDFTALKTAIQNAVKLNGNEEITGDILQGVLLSIVSTLGDSAINDLVTAISNETTARQNGDSTLNGYITALQGAVNSINTKLAEGYVYVGIATTSTNPSTPSGKVFYIAVAAGTYTNFLDSSSQPLVLTQGINILKYNDTSWSVEQVWGVDDAPTPSSTNLVKSGGVFDKVMTDGSAFDISSHFASGGTLATYADLSAALTALNTLSASYKRGGMSIKFVQSSDNKYVEYFCNSQTFTTDVGAWEKTNLYDEVHQLEADMGGTFILPVTYVGETAPAIRTNGTIYDSTNYWRSNKLFIPKGYTVSFNIILDNIYIAIIATTNAEESSFTCVFPNTSTSADVQNISWKAPSDCYIVISANRWHLVNNITISKETLPNQIEDIRQEFNNSEPLEEDDFSFSNESPRIYSENLKKGVVFSILINNAASTPVTILGQPVEGGWVVLGSASVGVIATFEIPQDLSFVNIGGGSTNTASGTYTIRTFVGGMCHKVPVIEQIAKTNKNNIDLLKYNLIVQKETGQTSTGTYAAYNTQNIKIQDGEYYIIKTDAENSTIYIMWNDGSYIQVEKNTINKMEYPSDKTFGNIRVFIGNLDTPLSVFVEADTFSEEWEKSVKDVASNNEKKKIQALILGDSYSQNGGQWVRPMMTHFSQDSSWISLAVGSASLKDKYQDRETYPYTSRPISSDNTGNHNTLACQIEKLKRLMVGTDLDAGETPIYQTPDSYPNVIIIAGGKNDMYDYEIDNLDSYYWSQLNRVVSNVYRKMTSSSPTEIGNVTIKTPIDEVDRTCFAGAYRYLVEELLTLFPNANIYFATVSPISYRNGGNVAEVSTITSEQQRKCADILGATIIDWHKNGQINSVMNYAQGSGTQDDPYIWAQCTLPNRDTDDQLHINARGGEKYGKCAANVINSTLIEID